MNVSQLGGVALQWEDTAAFAALLGVAAPCADIAAVDAIVRFATGPVSLGSRAAPVLFHGDTQVWLGGEPGSYLVDSPHGRLEVSPTGDVIAAVATGADLALFAAVPLSVSLALAMRRASHYHVHAALVEIDGICVALTAPSCGGKSTTLLSLVAAGASCACDDAAYLAVRAGGELRACGLPRPLHLSATTYAAFADLTEGEPPGAEGRTPLTLARPYLPSSTLLPIDAVVSLEIHDAPRSSFAPTSEADALGVLLEASAWAALDAMPDSVRHLTALSRLGGSAPCLAARCGRDVLDSPREFASDLVAAIRRGR